MFTIQELACVCGFVIIFWIQYFCNFRFTSFCYWFLSDFVLKFCCWILSKSWIVFDVDSRTASCIECSVAYLRDYITVRTVTKKFNELSCFLSGKSRHLSWILILIDKQISDCVYLYVGVIFYLLLHTVFKKTGHSWLQGIFTGFFVWI